MGFFFVRPEMLAEKRTSGVLSHTRQHVAQRTGVSERGQRFYSPEMGRWLSRDPIGERGGVNVQTFCSANPVNRKDPLGLDARVSVQGNNVLVELPVAIRTAIYPFGLPRELADAINNFKKVVETKWSGCFGRYNVTARVVPVTDDRLYNDVSISTGTGLGDLGAEVFDGRHAYLHTRDSANTVAHEAGHLMGIDDYYPNKNNNFTPMPPEMQKNIMACSGEWAVEEVDFDLILAARSSDGTVRGIHLRPRQ